MNLLHTTEEILKYERLDELANKLKELGENYGNKDLVLLSLKYKAEVELELAKYNTFIGIKCTCPDSDIKPTGSRRKGAIEGNFYFNSYSKSVRCNFRYALGGFDIHAIIKLEEL